MLIEDYVIATGVTHSINDFLNLAFAEIGTKNRDRCVSYDVKFPEPDEIVIS